jgi:glycosyltransferase involved in cell wall biosynthesis
MKEKNRVVRVPRRRRRIVSNIHEPIPHSPVRLTDDETPLRSGTLTDRRVNVENMDAAATQDTTGPMFSVVIPTYNRAGLLRRACDSVLNQSWQDLELIIVDDGSTDGTTSVVSALADERVRYLKCEHRGVSATRNEGAQLARGRYIVFLDSDDLALPSWLEQFAKAISSAAPDLGVCGTEAVGDNGVTLWRWSPAATHVDPSELAEHFAAGQVMFRRELFLTSGGFTPELRFGENTELALRLFFGTTASPVTVMVPLVLVRRRPAGIDEDYTVSRVASAAYVLEHHRKGRRKFRKLWASYHAILGTDDARFGRWGPARRHFAAALMAYPRREHATRLALSLLPAAARAAWPMVGHSRSREKKPSIQSGPPSVLFVAIAPGLGGSTRSLATLLGHLDGTRRVVACPSPTAFTRVLDERGLFEQRITLSGERRPRVVARVSAAFTLAAYAKLHRTELTAIHANGLAERNLVALAALVSRRPVVVWVHDWSVSPWSRRLAPLHKLITPDTRFAAVSAEAKTMLVSAGLTTAENVTVVPNPIDLADVRATHRAPGPGVTVGYLGTPAHYKGFHLLPTLIRSLAAEDLHWVLFAGPESLMPNVWQELRAFPHDDVEIPGKVTDVREAYGRCHIVVCPSLHESFGRVVAEAMANGIPVVASDLPPVRRLLGNDEAGLLVTPGDVDAAAAAIRQLAGDLEQRERMGHAGMLRVKQYEPNPVAALMSHLYE